MGQIIITGIGERFMNNKNQDDRNPNEDDDGSGNCKIPLFEKRDDFGHLFRFAEGVSDLFTCLLVTFRVVPQAFQLELTLQIFIVHLHTKNIKKILRSASSL